MKKYVLITLLLIVHQSWAQNNFDTKNKKSTKEQDVIYVSAQLKLGYNKMPLSYDVRTTRIESIFINRMNNYTDTITTSIVHNRWIKVLGTNYSYDGVTDLFEDYDKGYYLVARGEGASSDGNGWNIKTNINGSLL